MTMEEAVRPHPTPKFYWGIAAFLAIVTAIEVTIPQIGALDSVKVPLLWFLAAVKFVTVVAVFMHLRYDRKLYRTLFMFGAIGVFPLFIVVLLSLHAFS
ncbi:MAG: cytochrome C oxidase subunit IV family protein [Actinomycetota bacterium]|nr:cytochrome C oxidase subunit IV family protein [Actinomycetota bacterium]